MKILTLFAVALLIVFALDVRAVDAALELTGDVDEVVFIDKTTIHVDLTLTLRNRSESTAINYRCADCSEYERADFDVLDVSFSTIRPDNQYENVGLWSY